MTTSENLDFSSACKNAKEHLSRYFNVRQIEIKDVDHSYHQVLEVELEVLQEGKLRCITIRVMFHQDFPLSLPSIYLHPNILNDLGYCPNIDTNGLICTFDPNTNIPNPDSPGLLVEICVRMAKNIIEKGLRSYEQLDRYDNEFIAYWENKYGDEKSVNILLLSLLDENGQPHLEINYVIFESPFGMFTGLLYSEDQSFLAFSDYLTRSNVRFSEVKTFYLGQLDINPPFCLSNKNVLLLMQDLNRENDFLQYLKSKPLLPIVTFSKVINGRNLVFGWIHDAVEMQTKHRKGRIIRKEKKLSPANYYKLLKPENGDVLVKRFSPEVFNRERLYRRSASQEYLQFEEQRINKILIAGLGSIGSSLIPFLEKAQISQFNLVDSDILTLANIGRHLLGLNAVYKHKTLAIKDYLENKNPLIRVNTREEKIVPILRFDEAFFKECDCFFFCTGDFNSEKWVADNILHSDWCRPSFFIWVEPYLAGGHCIYFNGIDPIKWDEINRDNIFIYNVISEESYTNIRFTKREAGCQSTYFPYSALNLNLFLASLFPKIAKEIKNPGKSWCSSWIGDLTALETLGIKLSAHVTHVESFSLVERPLC